MIFTTSTVFDRSKGLHGPNDGAYKAGFLEEAALRLRKAIGCHVGYSHSACVTMDHPLVQAMKHLAEEHRKCVFEANRGHDPALLEIPDSAFVTPEEFWKPRCDSCMTKHYPAEGCPGPPGPPGAVRFDMPRRA